MLKKFKSASTNKQPKTSKSNKKTKAHKDFITTWVENRNVFRDPLVGIMGKWKNQKRKSSLCNERGAKIVKAKIRKPGQQILDFDEAVARRKGQSWGGVERYLESEMGEVLKK